jgi:hypothetical protein
MNKRQCGAIRQFYCNFLRPLIAQGRAERHDQAEARSPKVGGVTSAIRLFGESSGRSVKPKIFVQGDPGR